MGRRDMRSKLAELKTEKTKIPTKISFLANDFANTVDHLNGPALARNKEQFMFLPCSPKIGCIFLETILFEECQLRNSPLGTKRPVCQPGEIDITQ